MVDCGVSVWSEVIIMVIGEYGEVVEKRVST
jgi:hypothetical protein